jgi:hypothetical protein
MHHRMASILMPASIILRIASGRLSNLSIRSSALGRLHLGLGLHVHDEFHRSFDVHLASRITLLIAE